jgi:mRNA interferase HigB
MGTNFDCIIMKVVGREIIEDFVTDHAELRGQINAWLCEVEEAAWKNTQDIKDRYSHASFLSNNLVVFNLKGNKYRLVVKINYYFQIIKIEKIGTHAEYSKWNL